MGGSDLWLNRVFWWTSALVLVCGGFDGRRAKGGYADGFNLGGRLRWPGDWLGCGGALGWIRVVGEEAGRGGSVEFGLVQIRTSAWESVGAGTYPAAVAIDGSMAAMWRRVVSCNDFFLFFLGVLFSCLVFWLGLLTSYSFELGFGVLGSIIVSFAWRYP